MVNDSASSVGIGADVRCLDPSSRRLGAGSTVAGIGIPLCGGYFCVGSNVIQFSRRVLGQGGSVAECGRIVSRIPGFARLLVASRNVGGQPRMVVEFFNHSANVIRSVLRG